MPTIVQETPNSEPASDNRRKVECDVAISFLMRDVGLASAINDKLSEGIRVFFFPRKQEELAGTDGMESMREPFLASRLNVVLYRPRWGHTPWTGVEAEAIKDACLENQYRNLFILAVEPTHDFPNWVPHNHVRFNYEDYGLEQAIGAIKARVQERGGEFQPLTPLRKAELLSAEQEYQWDRSSMNSQDGIRAITAEVEKLMREMERQINDINAHGHEDFECEATQDSCVIRGDQIGLIVRWNQPYGNSLDRSALEVEEYSGRLWLRRDPQRQAQNIPPDRINQYVYKPELSHARDYGWRLESGREEFTPTKTLADKCLLQFMDLMERARKGEVSPPSATPFRDRSPWTRR
jgi:hypothetical protein